ncbi:MAG: hypothetical protein KAG61_09780 [Bacteriovoracaceae bacterium]|nr:hypothetical protein [Bacteriovoracaceae bacterium]
MKTVILALLSLTQLSAFAYEGSQISETWSTILENVYRELPHTKVNMKRLKKWGRNKLEQSANRTLSDKNDILPQFEKLVHPNGVCLIGEWKVDHDSKYSGYFKNGSKGLIISRASVALSDTERGDRRSFGLAGKIYPTVDYNHEQKLVTANFFTLDDLGGTKVERFSDTILTNEPDLSLSLSVIFLARMASFVSKVFTKADSRPGLRQLWQISSLGERDNSKVLTPMWMRLKSVHQKYISNEKDFRSEIAQTIQKNGEAVYSIEVAGEMSKGPDQRKSFKQIGTIRYTQAIASEGCDHRLHFNHPKLRNDLR